MTMVLPYVIAGLLGLAVGSFLNVCIYRLPIGRSLAYPPSACPQCGTPLRWFENVPVLAWIALAGKCRTCKAPISAVYPMVEAFTGALFVWAWWQYGPGWLLFSHLLFGCALIVLFFIDLRHRILPNVITLPGIAIGFLLSFITPPGWASSLIGILLGGVIPFAIGELYFRLRGEEGLGMGDVKMLAMIGAFLGWRLMLLTLVVASLLGSIVGVSLIVLRHGSMKSALPFGTFLTLAAFVALVTGTRIISWYLGFF
jgi:leader peptidase (prepilin peptidase) / N-methyltransferase